MSEAKAWLLGAAILASFLLGMIALVITDAASYRAAVNDCSAKTQKPLECRAAIASR